MAQITAAWARLYAANANIMEGTETPKATMRSISISFPQIIEVPSLPGTQNITGTDISVNRSRKICRDSALMDWTSALERATHLTKGDNRTLLTGSIPGRSSSQLRLCILSHRLREKWRSSAAFVAANLTDRRGQGSKFAHFEANSLPLVWRARFRPPETSTGRLPRRTSCPLTALRQFLPYDSNYAFAETGRSFVLSRR